MNEDEGEFILAFTDFLVKNDFRQDQIVILSLYTGQLLNMNKKKTSKYGHLRNVKIKTVDDYQGEECDIIMLSLVRSNSRGDIGFLKVDNRVNVALSRAKLGLFMFGNANCIRDFTEKQFKIDKIETLWMKVLKHLSNKNLIVNTIEFNCKNHKTSQNVSKVQDFKNIEKKGCNKKCDYERICGHKCQYSCHETTITESQPDGHGRQFLCKFPCQRDHGCKHNCPENCHFCSNEKLCKERADFKDTCGHEFKVECYRMKQPEKIKCPLKCQNILSCGHECSKPCKEPCTTKLECKELCQKLLICGHKCKKKCFEKCDEGYCDEYCSKLSACGHICRQECNEKNQLKSDSDSVLKLQKCLHSYKFENGEFLESLFNKSVCGQKCNKNMSCGHPCTNKCGDPCSKIDKCEEITDEYCPKCGLKNLKSSKCFWLISQPEFICERKCDKILECKHKCEKECKEKCLENSCTQNCKRQLTCGHNCKLKCNQICDVKKCPEKCLKTLDCGHKCQLACIEDCKKTPCLQKCRIKLPCGHVWMIHVSSLVKKFFHVEANVKKNAQKNAQENSWLAFSIYFVFCGKILEVSLGLV